MFLAAPEPVVLIDQSFSLHEPGADGEQVGHYSLNAEELGQQITITESIEIQSRKGKLGLTSEVVYAKDANQVWLFRSASGETNIAGDIVMQVEVMAQPNRWAVSTTLFHDPQGLAYAEPKEIKDAITVPAGPVLFSSARAVIGSRIQAVPGETPIVWVEFPDDIDEPITVKEGFNLLRSGANEQGDYTLTVRKGHRNLGRYC